VTCSAVGIGNHQHEFEMNGHIVCVGGGGGGIGGIKSNAMKNDAKCERTAPTVCVRK
jgi:hypothetical protein